jgi:hypothetical protein
MLVYSMFNARIALGCDRFGWAVSGARTSIVNRTMDGEQLGLASVQIPMSELKTAPSAAVRCDRAMVAATPAAVSSA